MYLHCVKAKYVFLIGFGIGFIFSSVLLSIQDTQGGTFTCKGSSGCRETKNEDSFSKLFAVGDPTREIIFQHWINNEPAAEKTKNVTYNEWLKYQNHLERNNLDMDKYLYGPERRVILESDWLRSNIRITCVVFVQRIKLAKSIKHTWGKRCNDIYFFSRLVKDSDVPIINIEVKFTSSWQFLCEALNYIWKKNLEWIIIVRDETLAIPENLRYMVAPLNHSDSHYLGHAVVMWGQAYNVAQAGYVISRGVLEKLIKAFDNSEKCLAGGKYWRKEDYDLAKHLSSMGIYPSDTRDQDFSGTFHGYSFQNLLWGVARPSSYWTRALYPIRGKCCSPMSVTFTVTEPDKMYTLNYLLYHMYTLKGQSTFGAKKAPMSTPEEDIWKIALKEEFNITHLREISSDAYYEIWHAKYSEPEQFISRNHQNDSTDTRHSVH